MKNKLIISILAVCSLFLWGCPYESEVAIDASPSVKINASLIGTWKPKSGDSRFVVTKATDNTYRIEEKKKEGKSSFYSAFLSDVSGTVFLNAKEQGDDVMSTNYYLYKVVLNGTSNVKLYPVTENITEKFATSAELKAYIEKYMGLSFFFDKNTDDYTKE